MALLLLGMLPTPSAAQLIADPNVACHTSWDTASVLRRDHPGDVAAFAGGAIEICERRQVPYVGTLHEPPRRNALGICSIRSHEVALRQDRRGRAYEPAHDSVRARADLRVDSVPSGDPCPRLDDLHYVDRTGVPDGVFLALYGIWQQLQSAPQDLNVRWNKVPPDQAHALQLLAKMLADPGSAGHLRLTSMTPGGAIFLGPKSVRSYAYIMAVHDDRDWWEWYEIGIDWSDGQFVAVSASVDAI